MHKYVEDQGPTHPIFRKLELTDREWKYLFTVQQILKVCLFLYTLFKYLFEKLHS